MSVPDDPPPTDDSFPTESSSILPSSSIIAATSTSPVSTSISSPTFLTTPWRSSVPLAYLSYNPPYFTLLPRSAPLLVSVQNVLSYGIVPNQNNDSSSSSRSSPSTSLGTTGTNFIPVILYNNIIRIPLHIPIGPLYDLLTPLSSSVSPIPLSLTTLFDHTSGYLLRNNTGSTSSAVIPSTDIAQASFYSSIKQSNCLIRNTLSTKVLQSQRNCSNPNADSLTSATTSATPTPTISLGTTDLSKDILETQWNAAKNGDSTCSNLQTIGIIPSLATLTESSVTSSSSSFSYPIALRILSIVPIPVSALPLPGIVNLPSSVTHTVMIGTYCSDTVYTLRQALHIIFINENPNNINSTIQYNEQSYEIILHGVSTTDVPLLWDTDLASFIYPSRTGTLTNSLLHPDGFLYLALRKRTVK